MFNKIKIQLLKKKITGHLQKCENNNYYSLLNSSYGQEIINNAINKNDYKNLLYFFDLFTGWDNASILPKELGDKLEDLLNQEDYYLGIHRTNLNGELQDSEIAKSICKNGLKNLGDLSSGIENKTPNVNKTVSMINNILNLIIHIKTSYKNSTGAFVLLFSKDLINEDGEVLPGKFDEVYDTYDNAPTIKQEFILGYIENKNSQLSWHSKAEIINNVNVKSC